MKANELRIGNYVYCQDEINVIYGITKEGFIQYEKENSVYYCGIDEIKPIELTEEIFNSIPYSESVYLDQDLKGFRIIANGVDYDFKLEKHPYLHQLQNLYFALTNKEIQFDL